MHRNEFKAPPTFATKKNISDKSRPEMHGEFIEKKYYHKLDLVVTLNENH